MYRAARGVLAYNPLVYPDNLSRTLCEIVAGLSYDALPREVVTMVEALILDAVGQVAWIGPVRPLGIGHQDDGVEGVARS